MLVLSAIEVSFWSWLRQLRGDGFISESICEENSGDCSKDWHRHTG